MLRNKCKVMCWNDMYMLLLYLFPGQEMLIRSGKGCRTWSLFLKIDADASECKDLTGQCDGFFLTIGLNYFRIKVFLSMGSDILWLCRNPGPAIYVMLLRGSCLLWRLQCIHLQKLATAQMAVNQGLVKQHWYICDEMSQIVFSMLWRMSSRRDSL